jgi:hypothetical protein
LTELKDLWLQNNQLSLIEKGLFDKNLKLKFLFLNENKIVAIESTVFQNLNQQVNIHLVGNLCSNETFQGNQFAQNFACFKGYEILKPYLDKINQLESEVKISNDDKLACTTEKHRLNENLTVKSNDLSHCEIEKSSINQEKDKLAAKLKSKESESAQHLDRIRQLESETETYKNDKSDCVSEKNRLNEDLNAKLSDCDAKKSSINEDKINLDTKLESCGSELRETLEEKSTCLTEKDSTKKALNEMLSELSTCSNNLSECHRENVSIFQQLSEQLNTCQSKRCPDTSFYILICVVTVDFLIIILFVWKFVIKTGKSKISSNIDEVESHQNEQNLIYATLDLKPSTRIPIRTDQVIYSKVQ